MSELPTTTPTLALHVRAWVEPVPEAAGLRADLHMDGARYWLIAVFGATDKLAADPALTIRVVTEGVNPAAIAQVSDVLLSRGVRVSGWGTNDGVSWTAMGTPEPLAAAPGWADPRSIERDLYWEPASDEGEDPGVSRSWTRQFARLPILRRLSEVADTLDISIQREDRARRGVIVHGRPTLGIAIDLPTATADDAEALAAALLASAKALRDVCQEGPAQSGSSA